MMKGKSGFLTMVLSVLGIVLYVAMFSTVMSALQTLHNTAGASTFIAFQTIIAISPTVLLLGGVFAAGFFYYKGYKQAGVGGDTSGLLRIVLGVLEIILFVTLFATIITNFYSLYTSYGSCTTWIAFGTVSTILPTILFLAGIFAGGATAYSGFKARKAKKSGAFAR